MEEHFLELADVAFNQAYYGQLSHPQAVLISEKGNLVEVFADGKHKSSDTCLQQRQSFVARDRKRYE